MTDGLSLDHTAHQGHYRVQAEFTARTVEYFTDDTVTAEAARNGLRKAGADVTINAWCDVTHGYNLGYGDDE